MLHDLPKTIDERVTAGYYQFSGYFDARMKKTGLIHFPHEWRHMFNRSEMLLMFDELNGHIIGSFLDDDPPEKTINEGYGDIKNALSSYFKKLHDNWFNRYPYTYYMPEVSSAMGITLPELLMHNGSLRDNPRRLTGDFENCVITGHGHYFTIAHKDNLWAVDKNKDDWKKDVVWKRVFSLHPIIKEIRDNHAGLNALERYMLSFIIRPSSPGRNQKDQPYGVSLAALPQGLIEPS
ncbi:MAG: hypothetical protein GW778_08655 [Alphaproteobacteria bacterium]|nr:hypothetical protein [Alphaproteobacteria bacterium]